MKGLLKKEWYLQTRTGLGFLILTGVFAIAGAGGAEMSGFFATFAMAYIPLGVFSIFSAEEKWRWSNFVLCTPVSRVQVVLCKYIAMLCHAALVGLIYSAACFLFGCSEKLAQLPGLLSTPFLVGAVSLPLMFRLGSDAGRVAVMFIVIFFAVVISTLMSLGVVGPDASVSMELAQKLLPAVSLALFAASVPLSAWCYRKKGK